MRTAGATALDHPLDVFPAPNGENQWRRRVRIGLIDGPIVLDHPALEAAHIRFVGDASRGLAEPSLAHGTFVAGVLAARRGASAPALCPGCPLLVRPIFFGSGASYGGLPTATSDALAVAILDCLREGARVLNLSLAPVQPALARHRALEAALDFGDPGRRHRDRRGGQSGDARRIIKFRVAGTLALLASFEFVSFLALLEGRQFSRWICRPHHRHRMWSAFPD